MIDGLFAETKELVAGFWLWQVRSMDEAVEWVKRCPNPMPGTEAEIEIRPLYETEDFAAAEPTGELRKLEHELRKTIEERRRCKGARPQRPRLGDHLERMPAVSKGYPSTTSTRSSQH